MKRLLLATSLVVAGVVAVALVPVSGCDSSNDNSSFDMGSDFAIGVQVTHVGVKAPTCCIVTRGADLALYLANPKPGTTDQLGHEHPATGELHLVNAYGVDFMLAKGVPAFGYQFTPDGNFAMFAQQTTSSVNYALNFASVSFPDTQQPQISTVIPDGIQDFPLDQQSFFSPTGKYLIIGVLPGMTASSPDLHIVDVRGQVDVAKLPNGAFNYAEIVTPDDTMLFNNSTASMTPGVPSQEGLYIVNLSVFGQGSAQPALLDQKVTSVGLMSDGVTVLYTRQDKTLVLYDLKQKIGPLTVASNVSSFTTGPGSRGPIVWFGPDGSMQVALKLAPAMVSLPAGTADPFTPVVFAPDGQRMYWFKNLAQSNSNGDLWTMRLPDGKPQLIGTRISSRDFTFFADRFLYIRNVDASGTGGELVSAAIDGSSPVVMGEGVELGALQAATPLPPRTPGHSIGPYDLGTFVPPPIFAGLSDAKRVIDTSTGIADAPINSSSPVVGKLAYGPSLSSPMGVLDPAVHDGLWRFSDDGYVLAYAGGASWNKSVSNFVGKLVLQPTITDTGLHLPDLDGVAEIGPIRNRAMFVSAPANSTAGIYFIKF